LNGSYHFEYNIIDHVGNVRLTFDKDPSTSVARRVQSDEYYPFGKRKSVSPVSLDNEYLFNGKELQEELGEYDYGARFYDPEIGRFTSSDPVSSKYSSSTGYNYVFNNPSGISDPSGEDPFPKPGLHLNYAVNIQSIKNGFFASFGIGLSAHIADMMYSASSTLNVYNAGLGTLPGDNKVIFDWINTLSMTMGYGDSDTPAEIPSLTSETVTAVNNPYKSSFTFGKSLIINSEGRNQLVGNFGLRLFKGFRFNFYNDAHVFQKMGLSDGEDRWWTGGGFIQLMDKEKSITLGMDVFTGLTDVPAGDEMIGEKGAQTRNDHYDGGIAQEIPGGPSIRNSFLLNQGKTTLTYRTDGAIYTFNGMGKGHMYPQNFIHKLIKFHLIPSSIPNTFFAGVGIYQ
jgi:RHS repeat-associated protein